MAGSREDSPIIAMMKLILHGIILLLQFLSPVRNSRYGGGSNRLTDNINYRLFLLCIEAVFENKRRVDLIVSILPLESDVL